MLSRKCEICGLRSGQQNGIKRFFMARFPLDADRCIKWVKITGNEDLAYLPLTKLNTLKFLCGNHFRDADFNKQKTRLKKSAIPSLRLSAQPLSNEKLLEFPYHISNEEEKPIERYEISRKCCKCGRSPAKDYIKLYRFPKPGIRNLGRCTLWAMYMFPSKPYYSLAFQKKAYKEHKMLCSKHFKDTDFSDLEKTQLFRDAVPSSHEAIAPKLEGQAAPSLFGADDNVLHDFPDPVKDKERFLTWVNAVGSSMYGLNHHFILKNRKICNDHFETKYLTWTKKLSYGAVPTLSMPGLDNVILHMFPNPLTQTKQFRLWVLAIGGGLWSLDDQKIHKYRRVCHTHFESRFHTWSKRLSADAVPTLCLSSSVMHSFPNFKKDLNRFKLWCRIVGGDIKVMDDYKAYIRKKICNIHFISEHKNRFNRLSSLAVPLLHLPGQKNVPISKDLSPTKPGPSGLVKLEQVVKSESQSVTQDSEKDEVTDDNSTIYECEEYLDDYDDVQEVEIPEQPTPFSWDKSKEAIPVTDDDGQALVPEVKEELDTQLSLYCESDEAAAVKNIQDIRETHFRCNGCSCAIEGVRYTCVECADYDLCPPCDACGVHDTHYVLRVPRDKPHWEVRAVVRCIRRRLRLMQQNISIKEESDDETAVVTEMKDAMETTDDEGPPEPQEREMALAELAPAPPLQDPLLPSQPKKKKLILRLQQIDKSQVPQLQRVNRDGVKDENEPTLSKTVLFTKPFTEKPKSSSGMPSKTKRRIEVNLAKHNISTSNEPPSKRNVLQIQPQVPKFLKISKDSLIEDENAPRLSKSMLFTPTKMPKSLPEMPSRLERVFNVGNKPKRKRTEETPAEDNNSTKNQSTSKINISQGQPQVVLKPIDPTLYGALIQSGKISASVMEKNVEMKSSDTSSSHAPTTTAPSSSSAQPKMILIKKGQKIIPANIKLILPNVSK